MWGRKGSASQLSVVARWTCLDGMKILACGLSADVDRWACLVEVKILARGLSADVVRCAHWDGRKHLACKLRDERVVVDAGLAMMMESAGLSDDLANASSAHNISRLIVSCCLVVTRLLITRSLVTR